MYYGFKATPVCHIGSKLQFVLKIMCMLEEMEMKQSQRTQKH